MPYAIAAALALLALGHAVTALRADSPPPEPVDGKAIALVLAGIVVPIALLAAGGGFIAGIAALFALISTAFGRRRPLIDFAIGLGLGLLIFLLFDRVLTLALPAGPLERLL